MTTLGERDDQRRFDVWMQTVDRHTYAIAGLSVHDLEDCNFWDWFELGMSPKTAAKKAIRRSGGQS